MNNTTSELVERSLSDPALHQEWEDAYRTSENVTFFQTVIDDVLRVIGAPRGSTFMDIGCGSCVHAMHLGRRGYRVQGVDYSASVLRIGQANIERNHLDDTIRLQRANLLELPFADETVDHVLLWAVLMHVPEVETAISEVSRIIRPGGTLVVMENNMYSLQALVQRIMRSVVSNKTAEIRKTPAGSEYWTAGSYGPLVTRRANIGWLIRTLEENKFVVKRRIAGQFTEAYTRVRSKALVGTIHLFNELWFRFIRIPQPAFGNIIILTKR